MLHDRTPPPLYSYMGFFIVFSDKAKVSYSYYVYVHKSFYTSAFCVFQGIWMIWKKVPDQYGPKYPFMFTPKGPKCVTWSAGVGWRRRRQRRWRGNGKFRFLPLCPDRVLFMPSVSSFRRIARARASAVVSVSPGILGQRERRTDRRTEGRTRGACG